MVVDAGNGLMDLEKSMKGRNEWIWSTIAVRFVDVLGVDWDIGVWTTLLYGVAFPVFDRSVHSVTRKQMDRDCWGKCVCR